MPPRASIELERYQEGASIGRRMSNLLLYLVVNQQIQVLRRQVRGTSNRLDLLHLVKSEPKQSPKPIFTFFESFNPQANKTLRFSQETNKSPRDLILNARDMIASYVMSLAHYVLRIVPSFVHIADGARCYVQCPVICYYA
jgi:hypothetical protein